MRTRSLMLAGLAVATLVAVPASGKDKTLSDPIPDETGCRDVVDGTPLYQNLIAAIEQEEAAEPVGSTLDLYRKAVITVRDKGVASAVVRLAEPSCPDVAYTLEVYDIDSGALIASHTQVGDGVSGTEATPLVVEAVVRDYAKQSVGMRLITAGSGVTHDRAPDGMAAEANAEPDGLPPIDTPATSSFK